jgi:hypothetical protein
MQGHAAALVAALLLPASVAAPASKTPLAHFSVTLERSVTGWSAECQSGCAATWKASFTCAPARQCGARVDAIGIITLANNRRLDPKFSFTLKGTVDGITASHSNGTEWISLMWGCGQAPCRARMTELGVETLPPAR